MYPDQLNEETAFKLGRVFYNFIDGNQVVVGRDMRLSADTISSSLIDGLLKSGADVINVGMVSTPMIYFAIANYGVDGGIMVTASHNPAKYNGFKLSKELARPIFDDEIARIRDKITSEEFSDSIEYGKETKKDILKDYTAHVLKFAENIKNLKIVIDAANGIAGSIVSHIFKDLDIEIIPLYFELDGSFPNHEADPLKHENLRDLQTKVVESKADIGIGYDGDADRLIFVDDCGEIIGADLITALVAQELIKKHPNSKVIYDLRSSRIVKDAVEKAGGKAIKSRVGHAFIKEIMREENALFGGELSGHYYYRENWFADNSDITAIMVMNAVSSSGKKLSELIEPLKIYCASGEINFEVEDKDKKIEEIEQHFSDGEVSKIDGLLVEYDNWWFNLRKSNTEPLLRLNVEADSKEILEKNLKSLKSLLVK